MNWITRTAAVAGALVLMEVSSQAAVVLNVQGSGSAAVVYEGNSRFINSAQNFDAVLIDTIIEKTLTGNSLVFNDVTFAAGDLDFTGGFRWSERVHNNTGNSWIGFEMVLDDTPGVFFTDLPTFSPGLVSINAGGAINAASLNTLVRDASLGSISLSTNRKTLSITFATPVAPGSFFDVHAPIEQLGSTTSFELRESPVAAPGIPAVPLPSAAFGGFGLLGALLALRGMRRV